MLNYTINTEILRIFNRNLLQSIDILSILINKQFFDCELIELNSKYIYFKIDNIGLIQPNKTTKYEYKLYADNVQIDNGYIKIN